MVRHRWFDDQDLLVFFGHGQVGERRRRGRCANRDIGLVVLIRLRKGCLGQVRLALIVLGDDDDLAPVQRHAALGGILKAHAQPGFGLLRISFQWAGLAIDQRDLQVVRLRGANQA